ncbi:MAG TPA: peptidase M16, partial [Lachnospiraceae bacterium]|nr:peptidase M16 [Lachnospiraceae bacterium]
DFIDQNYLSEYDAITVNSEIMRQTPFEEMITLRDEYPISDEDEETENTYLAWNVVTGDPGNIKEMIAFDVIDYALFSMPGAPVKQALLDHGIGKDINSLFSDGILQPYFSVSSRNAEESQAEEFVRIIRETLEKQISEGIDRKSLLARINYMEFQFREADYATYPKGLMYGIDVFDTWLYDESNPFVTLRQLDAYESLRRELDGDYFEKLIKEKILDNPHAALIILAPKKGLQQERDQKTAEKLAAYKASLSEEEIEELVEATKALKAYQEKADTPEDIECLPMLTREDIGKKARQLSNIECRLYEEPHEGINPEIIFHRASSNGIGYMDIFWDIHNVPMEEIPYIGLLKAVLANVNTASHTYMDLNNEINMNTGGIAFNTSVFEDLKSVNASEYRVFFSVRGKALYGMIGTAIDYIREVIT